MTSQVQAPQATDRSGPPRWRAVAVSLFVLLTMFAAACSVDSQVTDTTTTAADAPASSDAGSADAGSEDVAAQAAAEAAQGAAEAAEAATEADSDDTSGSATDTAASPVAAAAVRAARQAAQDAGSLQFELYMEMSLGAMGMNMGSRSEPTATGSTDGNHSTFDMDMGVMMGAMAAMIGDPDMLTMHQVISQDVVYMHAPFFGAMVGQVGADVSALPPEIAWMAQSAEGWVKFDVAALGDHGDLSQLGITPAAGADQVLALLDGLESVTESGTGQIRDVATTVYRGQTSLAEMIEASGQSIESLVNSTGAGMSPAEVEAMVSDFSSPADLEVHIDADNLVRRISYELNLSEVFAASGAPDMDMDMWVQTDMFDYGVPVEIEVPTDAPDITADLIAALDAAG